MSLLQSAIGRGLEQLGDTASKGILMQAHQRHEDEMEQARALRAENLQRLSQQFQSAEAEKQRSFITDRADTEYDRGPSGMINPESGMPMTREEAQTAQPEGMMTQKEYDLRNETDRSKRIGESVGKVTTDFKWDAKDPQQSAVAYMQKLRSTGELTESEVVNETNRMLQAKTPKDAKLQVVNIGVGGEQEQSAIVNLTDGTVVKTLGKPTAKWSNPAGGVEGKGRMTENQASEIIRKLLEKQSKGDELTAGETELMDLARARLGKTPKAKLADVFQGNGQQMPIASKGKGNAYAAAPPKSSAGGYTFVNGKLVPN